MKLTEAYVYRGHEQMALKTPSTVKNSGLGTHDSRSTNHGRSEGGYGSTETLAVEERGVLERFAVGTLVFKMACGLKL